MTRSTVLRKWWLIALILAPLGAGCEAGRSADELMAEGQTALAEGEWRAAVIAFKNLLQDQPQNAEARALLGRALLRLGDVAAARQAFERAQRLGAEPLSLQPWLALAWLSEGEHARIEALTIPEQASDALRAELLAIQSQAALLAGDDEGAATRAEAALAADQTSPRAQLAMARVLLEAAEIDAARALAEQASSAEDPAVAAGAWVLLAELARDAGDLDAAEAAYGKALSAPTERIRAQLGRTYVRIQAGKFEVAQADIDRLRRLLKDSPLVDYAQGMLDYSNRDFASAIESLDAALGASPDFAPALYLAGATRLALNEPELAQIHLQRAVSERPDDLAARRLLATALLRLGDAPGAERQARQVLEQRPGDIAMMDLLASALMRQGKRDEGVDYLRQVKAEIPESAVVNARLGAALLDQGDANEGLQALQEAIARDPEFSDASEQLILGLLRGGDLDAALEAARDYRDREPDSVRALVLLGAVHLRRQEPAAANEVLRAALEREPHNLAALNGLAMIRLGAGDLAGARAQLEQGLGHRPDSVQLLVALAKLAVAEDDLDAAAEYLQRARASAPDALEPQLYLAAYHLRIAEPEQALRTATAARQDFPEDPRVLRLLAGAELALQRYAGAIATLERLGRLTPDDPRVLVSLASAQLGVDDLAGAGESLRQAQQLDAEFVPALRGLVQLAIVERDVVAAERWLRALATQLGVDHPDTLLLTGRVAQLQGNGAAAQAAFTRLLGSGDGVIAPEGPRWRAAEQLISGYLRGGDPEAALAAAERLAAQQPEAARGHVLVGELLQQLGRDAAATHAWRLALEHDPGNVAASAGLAELALAGDDLAQAQRLFEAAHQTHPEAIAPLVGLARVAQLRDDGATAQDYLERAVAANPTLLQPRLYLAAFALRAGDPAAALAVLDPVREAHPDDLNLLALSGEAELALGRYQEARASLQRLTGLAPTAKSFVALAFAEAGLDAPRRMARALEAALELDPESVPALSGLAQYAIVTGKPERAAERIAELRVLLGAEHPDVLALEGRLALRQGEYAVAQQRFGKLLERAPSGVNLRRLVQAQLAAGTSDEAVATMLRWLDAHPDDVESRFVLAQLYLDELQRPEAAIAQFEQVLEAQPDNLVALNNLAWLLQEQAPARALSLARRAHQLAPEAAPIADTLAVLLWRAGELDEARALIDQALASAPDDATMRFHKARILETAGEIDEARVLLQALLQDTEDFAERGQAEALLQGLGDG
ncbi:XrtA/PEP-CTERM system TPR-repeat protein PrsT [Marichromatium bheemlicum]|uniref:PEP-CTERM system TPR-repeat protein PrsT n=1 Tax=Marichromatium bheemlicum TaxID=365339 RepID=A0ABX1IBM1_9GAMM|nr:XrtA/PEP-CTERM system TPR-repeat protein PrsT [Marichromatium bheemlicum]NKN34301.1 PEP-CTERM system TPR-repeat protein PrsT [Marichromatium bheemlicum]